MVARCPDSSIGSSSFHILLLPHCHRGHDPRKRRCGPLTIPCICTTGVGAALQPASRAAAAAEITPEAARTMTLRTRPSGHPARCTEWQQITTRDSSQHMPKRRFTEVSWHIWPNKNMAPCSAESTNIRPPNGVIL